MPTLLKGLSGKVVAERGYISQKLFEQLYQCVFPSFCLTRTQVI
ncbi:hypothetical protein H6F73_25390 [Microcoleus sp. FACHB-68]|nr:hypothetical protein [Microcoleus sp. FACHB-68]